MRLLRFALPALLIALSACAPKGTAEPVASSAPAAGSTIEIVGFTPAPAQGLSANDPLNLVIRYQLEETDGILQVWFERFEDAACSVPGTGADGSTSLPGTSYLDLEGGGQELDIALQAVPPLDAQYVGVSVRLWDRSVSSVLAEDVRYEWCLAARAAIPALAGVPPVDAGGGAETATGTGAISGSVYIDGNDNATLEPGSGTDSALPDMLISIASADCLTTLGSTRTDNSGSFLSSGWAPGTYCVILHYAGLGRLKPGHHTWVTLQAGGTSPAVFTILP